MTIKHGLAGAVLGALTLTSFAAPPLASTDFDSSTEGWNGINGVLNFHWVATGGQSGGFVQGRDFGAGEVWLFDAPTAYLGDQSAAYGGTLSFYLRQSTTANQFTTPLPDVKITGNGMSLVIDAGDNPGLDWTSYTVTLKPGAWHIGDLNGAFATKADFETVLADVSALRIRAEYSNARGDVDGIDSVKLLAVPVPEPRTYALMLAGLGAVGFMARRGKRNAS